MENLSEPQRTSSIVGTMEYMAPEIMSLQSQKRIHQVGYTRAIDFWSLGVMIYKLLTGITPYCCVSDETFFSVFPAHVVNYETFHKAYVAFFGTVNYEICNGLIDSNTKSVLQGLLEFDPDKRLGYNSNNMLEGYEKLMNHPFFANIDWNLLESKRLPPPYIPEKEVMPMMIEEYWMSRSLCEILLEANKRRWCEEFVQDSSPSLSNSKMHIPVKDEQYFSLWYYVDPSTIVDTNEHT